MYHILYDFFHTRGSCLISDISGNVDWLKMVSSNNIINLVTAEFVPNYIQRSKFNHVNQSECQKIVWLLAAFFAYGMCMCNVNSGEIWGCNRRNSLRKIAFVTNKHKFQSFTCNWKSNVFLHFISVRINIEILVVNLFEITIFICFSGISGEKRLCSNFLFRKMCL